MRSPRTTPIASLRTIALLGLLLPIACGTGEDSTQPATHAEAKAADDGRPASAHEAEAEAADGASAGPANADGGEAAEGEAADAGAGDEVAHANGGADTSALLVPPPAESLTMHGLAAYEVVTIYAKPNLASTKLGYLRFGHRTMVTPKIADEGEGCPKGWHQLPAGGHACASKGLTVEADKEPYMYHPPPRPRIEEPMPYDYGAIARDGTETWWRPATAAERQLAAEKFALLQEEAAAAAAAAAGLPPPPPKAKPAPKPKAGDGAAAGDDGGGGEPLPGVDDPPPEPAAPPSPEELAELARKAEEERLRQEEERKARLEQMSKLPLHPEHPFLERGFTITTALKVNDQGRTWWRTSRGGYLDAAKVYKKPPPKVAEVGVVLPETSGFPFGFAGDDKTPVFQRNEDGKLQRKGSLAYRTFVDGVEELEIDGKTYLRTADDTYVRASDLRLAVPQTPPQDLGGIDRWVDVDLSQQLLVAYEGERPVFTTLVSTGRKGTKEEPFDTPTGTFRIVTKHISSSMDGNTASDGNYSIQDVPWAMFFHGNYALHGAFWHAGFGGRRSHGCINLAVTDARWLFWWVGPELPEGWHGAAAHDGSPGSVVVVRAG
ncbi:L,D-transpeptidase [Paraliomyxa miuraensis]|uniref:L,D-transpeptidase n=1 Tax=Paraliomyxa miuraensis TaxID=376150 RepID=UPI00225569CE|nr:L,D-transpeptidase [Paraliomyxa miuraensis]MCX4243694.1 L,D-transpeptidase [Paraliomyxa miuraensis]